jgi:LPXTG-motif cell wall-anchored protein
MEVMRWKCLAIGIITAVFLIFGPAPGTQANTITAHLTGDFRPDNPDNLFVDVMITLSGNKASWIVDIDSPLHPDIRLGGFFFNLDLGGRTVDFTDFTPDNMGKKWGIVSGTNAVGSGGADFDFGVAQTGAGNPLPNAVTNATNLTFDMNLLTGDPFSTRMFFDAGLSTGGGIPDPGAQLGAHLQSLSTDGCQGCSDSGFASGNYVPIPPTILLLGTSLFGLGGYVGFRKRKKKS